MGRKATDWFLSDRTGLNVLMLQIRPQQMDVFRTQPRLIFEHEMANFLRRHYPFEAANADLDHWVRVGLDRAAARGFLTGYESALYLSLMAMLGAGFEEDPLIPWAAQVISNSDVRSLDRITAVYDRGIDYLDATGGPHCAWFTRAKLRLCRYDSAVLNRDVTPRTLELRIREQLAHLYPQKAAVAGDQQLKSLVRVAIERAEAHGATSARARFIQAIHMFYMGSTFDIDPCYPWAEATLAEVGMPEDLFDRMHRLSLDYFGRSRQVKT